jgi:hypothetical protein
VYAEAFERDNDPDDFRLEALIAHECGHQRLHRDPKLRSVLAKFPDDDLKAQLETVSARPSGKAPKATADPDRIIETLEALCTTLEREVKKRRNPNKARRRTAKP